MEIKNTGKDADAKTKSAAEYVKEARALLLDGQRREAYQLLIQAVGYYPENAIILSYYGYLQSLVDRKYQSALAACKRALALFEAADKSSARILYPILYLNLGRTCIAAGKKKEAIVAFTKGLSHDKSHPELKKEMRLLGTRKNPPVPFLSRSNPVNKYIGKMLHAPQSSHAK